MVVKSWFEVFEGGASVPAVWLHFLVRFVGQEEYQPLTKALDDVTSPPAAWLLQAGEYALSMIVKVKGQEVTCYQSAALAAGRGV